MPSRPRLLAVQSITYYFDTNIDHFYQKFRPLESPPFFSERPKICSPTPPRDLILYKLYI